MALSPVLAIDVESLLNPDDGMPRPYDASDQDWTRFAEQVRESCLNHGFIVLKGHGISDSLYLENARRFFSLPLETKLKYASNADNGYRGFTGVGGGHNCSACSVVEPKETFYCGDPGESVTRLGSELDGFHDRLEEFYRAMSGLSDLMLMGLSLSLGLPPTTLKERAFRDPSRKVLLAQYPPVESGIGCGSHTDCGFMTMLFSDGEGLELQSASGDWLAISATRGHAVFNIGDLAERWTNGLYKATAHRVVNHPSCARTSVIFFNNGDDDAVVSALPGTVAEGEEARHAGEVVTCSEFVQARLQHMRDQYRGDSPHAAREIAEPEGKAARQIDLGASAASAVEGA